MGRSVSATAHLDTASEKSQSAALIPLRQAGDSPDARDIPAYSFLERRLPSSVSLLNKNFNPRLNRQTQVSGLLILHADAPAAQPQLVFITVTAL